MLKFYSSSFGEDYVQVMPPLARFYVSNWVWLVPLSLGMALVALLPAVFVRIKKALAFPCFLVGHLVTLSLIYFCLFSDLYARGVSLTGGQRWDWDAVVITVFAQAIGCILVVWIYRFPEVHEE